nr:Ldh family oxidoreductase [Xanthobacter tagetidis]
MPEEALSGFCVRALMAGGLSEADARDVAAVLVFADKRGIASHGCATLPGYVHHLAAGTLNPRPDVHLVSDARACAVIDGDGGPGAVTALRCARLAVEKAKASGIGCVAARNSTHFGAGGYYALLMAQAGMIGEVISTAPPVMAPTGGQGRVLGNNPYAVAVPTRDDPALVFDMATSVAAGRKVIGSAAAGQPVPDGWLLDALGNPSTDPGDFLRGGALLPFGGHKGFGLALVFEVFAGILTGTGPDGEAMGKATGAAPGQGGTGHIFRATDVAAFMPLDAFHDRMAGLRGRMKAANRPGAAAGVILPGERAHAEAERSDRLGVPLAQETLDALTGMASALGIAPPGAGAI